MVTTMSGLLNPIQMMMKNMLVIKMTNMMTTGLDDDDYGDSLPRTL